ncbi:hypothetical protein B0H13DRAFT_1935129 [Mycena leptocephala]|nr:hypothetical protein B0H13DRAFT_1935129 [Mycena leptocephala]
MPDATDANAINSHSKSAAVKAAEHVLSFLVIDAEDNPPSSCIRLRARLRRLRLLHLRHRKAELARAATGYGIKITSLYLTYPSATAYRVKYGESYPQVTSGRSLILSSSRGLEVSRLSSADLDAYILYFLWHGVVARVEEIAKKHSSTMSLAWLMVQAKDGHPTSRHHFSREARIRQFLLGALENSGKKINHGLDLLGFISELNALKSTAPFTAAVTALRQKTFTASPTSCEEAYHKRRGGDRYSADANSPESRLSSAEDDEALQGRRQGSARWTWAVVEVRRTLYWHQVIQAKKTAQCLTDELTSCPRTPPSR